MQEVPLSSRYHRKSTTIPLCQFSSKGRSKARTAATAGDALLFAASEKYCDGVPRIGWSTNQPKRSKKYLNQVHESSIRKYFAESAYFVNFLLYFSRGKAHNQAVKTLGQPLDTGHA
jgi:hypothetical protein